MTRDGKLSGTVAFFDSGVGGLPYLKAARDTMPDVVMHYLADDAGFPYGTKSPELVRDLLFDRVRKLKARFQPEAIVIACDTASQIALSDLTAAHPDTAIIGTAAPIKKAAASTKSGKIGILATARTIEDSYLDDMVARYASDVETIRVPAQDLVSFVEYRYLYSTVEERRAAVDPYIKYFIERGADRIVLACTHFLHLIDDFNASIAELRLAEEGAPRDGQDILVVDSIEPVTKKLEALAAERGKRQIPADAANLGPEYDSCPEGEGCLLLTRDPPFTPIYSLWAKRFSLFGPEPL